MLWVYLDQIGQKIPKSLPKIVLKYIINIFYYFYCGFSHFFQFISIIYFTFFTQNFSKISSKFLEDIYFSDSKMNLLNGELNIILTLSEVVSNWRAFEFFFNVDENVL